MGVPPLDRTGGRKTTIGASLGYQQLTGLAISSEEMTDGERRAEPASQDKLPSPLPVRSLSQFLLTYTNTIGRKIVIELGVLACHEPGREWVERGIPSHFHLALKNLLINYYLLLLVSGWQRTTLWSGFSPPPLGSSWVRTLICQA